MDPMRKCLPTSGSLCPGSGATLPDPYRVVQQTKVPNMLRIASQRLAGTARSASRSALHQVRTMADQQGGSGGGLVLPAIVATAAAGGYYFYSTGYFDNPEPALNPKEFVDFTVSKVETLTHDTKRITFGLKRNQTSGITVAGLVLLQAELKGENVLRPYTPTTGPDVKGRLEFVIKKYDDGAFTPYVHSLKVGDKVSIKGPITKIKVEPNFKQEIGCVAGGTGITPMYQVIKELLRHPENKTKITLLAANKSESDILLKKELDELASKNPDRFTVQYVLDKAPAGKPEYVEGFVTAEVAKKFLPPPSENNLIMVCGPPGMMKAVSGDKNPDKSQGEVSGVLKTLGYTKDMVFKF
eukprot:Clim_evm24s243 gene=Clim_evmTU24s243